MIDGDTVEMEQLGRVRLIGVDTPEKGRCYDDQATRFTRDRLEGKVVRFELGVEPKDRYGRTLAYLSRGGAMHNLALVRGGYAQPLTIPPNDKYASRFEKAVRRGRASHEGMWDSCDRRRRRARSAALRRKREQERTRQAPRKVRDDRNGQRRADREGQAAGSRAGGAGRSSGGGDSGSGPGSGKTCKNGSPVNYCGKRDGDGDGCYCE